MYPKVKMVTLTHHRGFSSLIISPLQMPIYHHQKQLRRSTEKLQREINQIIRSTRKLQR
ncbi:unnamed protein product [Lactuca virosa]|uniref:Uncharacterized protein n=1 Tax=Lactuca virosa TaxID=75947 RepID=A0AAU9MW33_9ASTR|nr:unnamed protein product [Lactuca virosa]